MRDDLELMKIHLEVLFTHDTTGRMLSINEVGKRNAPRFFLGRTANGNEWRFRVDLEADLVSRLEAICIDEPVGEDISRRPHDLSKYVHLLVQDAPIEQLWTGPAYHFPDEFPIPSGIVLVDHDNADILQPFFGERITDLAHDQPVLALVQDGRAISVCCSARKTECAHEAGVETHPDFRGRGYAGQVVGAWAGAVCCIGCIPLYSTSWENAASQAVAAKLGLMQYGSDMHIT